MDIDGVLGLSEETRRCSDELRLRYRQVAAILDHSGVPVPAEIYGMVRVSDGLVGDAADLYRRAEMFRDAENMALNPMSLTMMLHSWAGLPIDPSNRGLSSLSVAGIEAEIGRLAVSGVDPQLVREFRVMLAMVTATEVATEREELQRRLDDLAVLPAVGWVDEFQAELEVQIAELLIEELKQEKLLLDLESNFACPTDWEHAERYEEIRVQIAYLDWQLANQRSDACLATIETLLGRIGEADLHTRMSFVEMVAGDLDAHPDGLPVALMLLADMDEPHQTAVMAEIANNGDLEDLFAAVDEFEESLEPERSSWGSVGDVVEGAWDSVWASVTGVWGLTFRGVYDWDGWKQNWSGLGQSFKLLFESPGDFLYQLADIETLKQNQARWLGGIVPDLVGAVFTGGTVTTAARSGRLGAAVARIANRLDNLSFRVGARMSQLVSDPTLRRMIERLADETGAIGRAFRVADYDPVQLIREMQRRGALPDDLFDQLNGHLLDKHAGWTNEQMVKRMDDTGLPEVSTFTDEATARRVTLHALTTNADRIVEWLTSPGGGGDLVLNLKKPLGDTPAGRIVKSSDRVVRDAFDARIVLRRTADGSWYILTGYCT